MIIAPKILAKWFASEKNMIIVGSSALLGYTLSQVVEKITERKM